MKHLSQTKQFVKDIKRMSRGGRNIRKLQDVVLALANGEALAPRHRDHPLIGEWKGSGDCHMKLT